VSACVFCGRRLGLLELVLDTPAGQCCDECDGLLPEHSRPSAGAVVVPLRPRAEPYHWPQVGQHPLTRGPVVIRRAYRRSEPS
jgi:hypothetical protein